MRTQLHNILPFALYYRYLPFLVSVIVGFSGFHGTAFAQATVSTHSSVQSHSEAVQTTTVTLPSVTNNAFGLGETLYYDIGYKFITAGRARFKVADTLEERYGRPSYDVSFVVKSLESLRWIYNVRNYYRTVVDTTSLVPFVFEQHVRENKYRKDYTAELDQFNLQAITKDSSYAIDPLTHDIVSAMYFVRTLPLRQYASGDTIKMRNFYGNKMHNLAVRVVGRQTVTVEAGRFRCIVIEPIVVEGGLFKNNDKIYLWMTDDERKIPVKVSSKIIIGSIDAELTSYKNIRGRISAQLPDK